MIVRSGRFRRTAGPVPFRMFDPGLVTRLQKTFEGNGLHQVVHYIQLETVQCIFGVCGGDDDQGLVRSSSPTRPQEFDTAELGPY